MKKHTQQSLVNRIVAVTMGCVSYVYTPAASQRLSDIYSQLYTFWWSRFFHAMGQKAILRRPLCLVGTPLIAIGDHATVGKHSTLTVWKKGQQKEAALCIGHHTHIGEYAHITCNNAITIGNHVLTGKGITITDNAHGEWTRASLEIPPIERTTTSNGPVRIGNNVWIGDKVTILSNVTIGDCATIGANAVVTTDIPAYAVAVGVPAKVIKQL
jgi:carbonic anhydrase/acetyltransferase-like protein (isoleucine patch superfamily)